MDYENTLKRIHSLNKFGSRPGLERVKKLLSLMGNPQDKLEFVHIAGTNGKGSVAAMLSSVLKESGYKTGLFISPYITDFCERIQIDNIPIPHEKLSETANYVFELVEKLNQEGIFITEFEFVMCLAFEYFLREKTEIVVLETGLGGKLDCTNVIKSPVCAVLTRIGLDHTDILGDTIEAIATQKCGIIKENTAVVSAFQQREAEEIIKAHCKLLNVPLCFGDTAALKVTKETLKGTDFIYEGDLFELALVGEHQLQNTAVALSALKAMKDRGFDRISREAEQRGIASAKNPARFEALCENPTVILDGAHNPDGVKTFADGVRKLLGEEKKILIIGMLADKDSSASIEYIKGLFDRVYTVPINNPRALDSKALAKKVREQFERVEAFDSIESAFDRALSEAIAENASICICGSLYLAGELRPYVLRKLS